MKNCLSFFFLILLVSIATTVSAKTIYYVTQNGTGDGSSWTKASGNIQTMIDKAVSGDDVWVAKGTYYPTTESIARDPRSRTFLLKSGVSLYGGFAGSEKSILNRYLSDLDSNGRVDSCELTNLSILSGDIDGVADIWTKTKNTVGETWKWVVAGNEANCYHVVTGTDNAKIDGFSVFGGNANSTTDSYGGGIYFFSTTTSYILNCTVSNCFAKGGGGGISTSTSRASAQSNSYVINCAVSNCSANSWGGGIKSNSSSGSISGAPSKSNSYVINCTVSNCSSNSNGGGIDSSSDAYNKNIISANSASSSITNCTISNCSAGQFGGGIVATASNSDVNVSNCTVSNCSASLCGGGIYNTSYSSDTNFMANLQSNVSNCFVSNCWAGSIGGGIYSIPSHEVLTYGIIYSYVNNCTVANCMAGLKGGGIYSIPGINSNSSKLVQFVTNCIISNCSANEGGGLYAIGFAKCATSNNKTGGLVGNGIFGSQSGFLSPDISIAYIQPTSFIGIAVTDAQKTELVKANWHLKESSPCINVGSTAYVPLIIQHGNDLDNNSRVLYGNIDIGAYEFVMPNIKMPVSEKFDDITIWDNSMVFYNSDLFNGGQNIKWTFANQKAVFNWQTNLTSAYKSPIFTYQIDGTKANKVFLRYDMYFQAYSGSISQLGTEKLNVEFSTDLSTWNSIATYSNANGTIANRTYKHDITSIAAGKTFFIRFNANGANSNRIEKWEIDNVVIDTDGTTANVKLYNESTFFYTINNGILNAWNLNESAIVQLFDSSGRLLKDWGKANNSIRFSLPAHGVYIVRAESKTGVESKKVVW